MNQFVVRVQYTWYQFIFRLISMKKVIITPGCIACGACEFVAPEVFEVTDLSRVKPGADIAANEAAIIEAVNGCPVGVIRYGEEVGDEHVD